MTYLNRGFGPPPAPSPKVVKPKIASAVSVILPLGLSTMPTRNAVEKPSNVCASSRKSPRKLSGYPPIPVRSGIAWAVSTSTTVGSTCKLVVTPTTPLGVLYHASGLSIHTSTRVAVAYACAVYTLFAVAEFQT